MTDATAGDSKAAITILDFWADWCGVCRLIDPVVRRVANGRDGVVLRKVNVVEAREVADSHKVVSLPTLVFLAQDGRELNRISGTMSGKQIEAALDSAFGKLS
jgi:thioredoxin-like negative regulator of GroEL